MSEHDEQRDDAHSAAPEEKSKSQRKREMTALQDLGEQLAALNAQQLRKLNLPEALYSAIKAAQDMPQRGARKRQLQYIGRLMRAVDAAPITAALEQMSGPNRQANAHFHKLEQWRERLLKEGDSAVQDLLDSCPQADRQHLRQLVRNALAERAANKPPRAARLLFTYLRELLGEA